MHCQHIEAISGLKNHQIGVNFANILVYGQIENWQSSITLDFWLQREHIKETERSVNILSIPKDNSWYDKWNKQRNKLQYKHLLVTYKVKHNCHQNPKTLTTEGRACVATHLNKNWLMQYINSCDSTCKSVDLGLLIISLKDLNSWILQLYGYLI